MIRTILAAAFATLVSVSAQAQQDPLTAIAAGDGGAVTGAQLAPMLEAGGDACDLTPAVTQEYDALAVTRDQYAAGAIAATTRDANRAMSIDRMAAAIAAEPRGACRDSAAAVVQAMHEGGQIGPEVLAQLTAAAESHAQPAAPAADTPAPAEPDAPAATPLPSVAEQPALPMPGGPLGGAMQMLTQTLGPLGPVIAVGMLAFLLIALTIPFLLTSRQDPMDRLKKQRDMALDDTQTGPRSAPEIGQGRQAREILDLPGAAKRRGILGHPVEAGTGGIPQQECRPACFHFAQFALGLLLLLLGVMYALLNSATGEPTTQNLILSILIPGAVGYMAPKYWVTRRQAARQEEITNGFPDALDMMLVCVEAGQSLDQAIIRVAREIRAGFPALADEFEIVSWEIKAGKDKINVLRDMAERAGVADVGSFVTVLIQSASFGTSVAEALRVYAAEMRDKRVMRAEEKANTLPTKMTLATMMLTVPPLLIILLGPSVYNIAETLGSMDVN